jgi:hypothetical protein
MSQSLEKLEKLLVDHLVRTIGDQQTHTLSATGWCLLLPSIVPTLFFLACSMAGGRPLLLQTTKQDYEL